MNNGKDFIKAVCSQLKFEGKICKDYMIIDLIRELSIYEMQELVNHGDVRKWYNQRLNDKADKWPPKKQRSTKQ